MSSGLLPYLDDDAVARGAVIYGEHCAACHGADLEGQADWRQPLPDGLMPAPPHDITGHTWHHDDALLFAITKYGMEAMVGGDYRSDMPGFGEVLSDGGILAVLAFIKSTWPEALQRRHDELNAPPER